MNKEQTKQSIDWNVIFTAIATTFTICTVIIGCYISISTRLTKIETVLIMQKIMPHDLMASNGEKK